MRIIINDFGGYPFPIQLSKFFAKEGYDVAHTYLSNIATPHGNMKAEEISSLTVFPIILNAEFKKYSVVGRIRGEFEYAKKLRQFIRLYKPDIFLSANTPLLAQGILLKECKRSHIKFIYWCQDIHSIAIEQYLSQRLFWVGKFVARYFKRKEIDLLERSDHVITITEAFNVVFKRWKVLQANLSVIHNWGPVDEITLEPVTNAWSMKFGLQFKTVVLYSGTLGMKHNPKLIAAAAESFKKNNNVVFVVISEGTGADMLKNLKLNNLLVLPYQDYEDLPSVLGCANILLSILEPTAAFFSVPSKVLTYLCAKKAIVLSVPDNNLSAKIVLSANAGLCVQPGDTSHFINAISQLIADKELSEQMGTNGRKYAEDNFGLARVAQEFLKIFSTL